jgi:hypothetical protein
VTLQEFCTSREFEEEFESFSKEYADLFLSSLDMKSGEEHPLEYYDAYRAYLRRFETKISDFIENVGSIFFIICEVMFLYIVFIQSGSTLSDFYLQCEEALAEDDLFGARRFFVEALLAVSEYPHFVVLMQSEVVKYKSRRGK